jgi:hypothetical protein
MDNIWTLDSWTLVGAVVSAFEIIIAAAAVGCAVAQRQRTDAVEEIQMPPLKRILVTSDVKSTPDDANSVTEIWPGLSGLWVKVGPGAIPPAPRSIFA